LALKIDLDLIGLKGRGLELRCLALHGLELHCLEPRGGGGVD
jgi:hypothetical protein